MTFQVNIYNFLPFNNKKIDALISEYQQNNIVPTEEEWEYIWKSIIFSNVRSYAQIRFREVFSLEAPTKKNKRKAQKESMEAQKISKIEKKSPTPKPSTKKKSSVIRKKQYIPAPSPTVLTFAEDNRLVRRFFNTLSTELKEYVVAWGHIYIERDADSFVRYLTKRNVSFAVAKRLLKYIASSEVYQKRFLPQKENKTPPAPQKIAPPAGIPGYNPKQEIKSTTVKSNRGYEHGFSDW